MSKQWDLGDFAKQLQIPPMRLLGACFSDVRSYTEHRIQKRSGGERIIREPSPELKRLQRLMHERVFRHVPVSLAVHGSIAGRSNVTHARIHEKARAAYILDMADAFTQATEQKVVESFGVFRMNDPAKALIVDLVTFKGSLPQGAPTSSDIWNMVCRELDASLESFAKEYGLVYTRYTDELVFSHENHISHEVRGRIRAAVAKAGFTINTAKTRYFHARHGALTVTGLNIANGRAKLSKKEVERIRAFIHRAATDRSITYGAVMSTVGYVRFVYGGYPYRGFIPKRIRDEVIRFTQFRNRKNGY